MIYRIENIGEYERSQETLEELGFTVDTEPGAELENYVQITYEPKIAIYFMKSRTMYLYPLVKRFPRSKEELLSDLVAEKLIGEDE